MPPLAPAAPGAFVVDSAADTDDGMCGLPSADCTLREAINAANAAAGTDTISFNIPGPGVQTIAPASPLPTVMDSAIIDGTTQPGYTGCPAAPLIELTGASAGAGASGLTITAGGSTVRGLAINRFAVQGIDITGPGDGNHVECSVIGLDPAGSVDLGNGIDGVRIFQSSGNVIGGTTAAERNVISGNTFQGIDVNGPSVGSTTGSNTIAGNYIGTNAAGTVALANANSGVVVQDAFDTKIGLAAAGGGNLISGNNRGIVINNSQAIGNVVVNNLIGTNAAGTGPLGNAKVGIEYGFSPGPNTVGGLSAGQANTIAYNDGAGIHVESGSALGISGNAIFANGGLGIDLDATLTFAGDGVTANDPKDPDDGGNGLQNFPDIVTALKTSGGGVVSGKLNSTPGRTFRVELFWSPACDSPGLHGEGATFLGSVTTPATDGAGDTAWSLATGPLTVGSQITSTATDSTTADTSEFSACAAVVGSANLSIGSATNTPDPVPPSGTLTDGFTISNSGPAPATGIVMTVDVGSFTSTGQTGVSGCTGTTGSFTCAVANIASGASQPVTFTLQAPGSTGGYSHVFGVSSAQPDPTPADASVTLSGSVAAAPSASDLALSASRSPEPVTSGDDLTESVGIDNIGGSAATGVSLHITFSNFAELASATGTSGPCITGTSDIICPIADISAGASRAVTLRVRNHELGSYTHTFTVVSAGDANPDNDSVSVDGTVNSPCGLDIGSCIWRIDPGAANPTATRALVVDDAANPSWGSAGRIAFDRSNGASDELWSVSPDGSGSLQLTSGSLDSSPWLNGTILAFGRYLPVGGSSFQSDIFLLDLSGARWLIQTRLSAPLGVDPAVLRVDIILDCGTSGGPQYLVGVALPPTTVDQVLHVATFQTTFDSSLACAGGTITVIGTAGIDRSTGGTVSTTTVTSADKAPVAAIYGPSPGSSRLQFDGITLRGSGKDPEQGELIGNNLTWTLTGPGGTVAFGPNTGTAIDVPVPVGGWTQGAYTATLTAADALASGTTSTTFTILADADNDGIPASKDKVSCANGAASADNDPSNAYGDLDGDGIPNISDPQPCQAPDPTTYVYPATANFDPNTLFIPSSGSTVTMYVSVAGKDMTQIGAGSVRLSRVNGVDPADPRASGGCVRSLTATAYSATPVQGVAKFSRQDLGAYLTCMGVMNRQIELRIEGASRSGISPAWRFEGTGVTTVKPG